MLFHASIPADNPERVARVIAELWQGDACPFPPLPESFIAMAGDERGTEIEVCPRNRDLIPADREVGTQVNGAPSTYSQVHLAVASPLSEPDVLAIAAREGWMARRCERGPFAVIEFWLEDKFMIEVLTDAEQKRYLDFMKPANFRAMFGLAA